jgi:rifampicin phosphotransferase
VRERVQRDWRGRLIVWPLFNWLLKYTQAHTRERDTMHFELTRLFPPMRRALLELGRRWTASGIFDTPDDVFYLSLDELLKAADSSQPQQALVQARRAELAASRRKPAPGILRDGQALEVEAAAQAVPGAGEFHGIAGSPGTATGAARLVLGPEDFGKLKSGEILVAPITNPVWTPLFAIAGGIVTEIGGILSHGAIVAREYGIPAVMGVPGITAAIAEGKRVTVDGNRGIVTVEM